MPISSHNPTLRSAAASLAVAALATIGGVAAESTAAVPWNCPISGSGISRGRTNKLQKLEMSGLRGPAKYAAAEVTWAGEDRPSHRPEAALWRRCDAR